jgi:hypothetical protein
MFKLMISIGNMFLKAVVFMFYWNTFFVLIGLPPINYGVSFGIMLGVGLLFSASRHDDEETAFDYLLHTFGMLVSWGIGAIVAACI